MTQQVHYSCSRDFGCVEHDHTTHQCYWRYVDEAVDVIEDGVTEGVMSMTQWLERRHG